MRRTFSHLLILWFAPLLLFSQNDSPLGLIIGEVKSISYDSIADKARKPFFNYKLLKEEGSTHYQLLKDEVKCCMDQLEKLYLE